MCQFSDIGYWDLFRIIRIIRLIPKLYSIIIFVVSIFDSIFNDKQQQAVTAPMGPVLVLAGPGSGKTKTLTHRMAYIIEKRMAAGEYFGFDFYQQSGQGNAQPGGVAIGAI